MRTTPFSPRIPNPRRLRPQAVAVALPGRDVTLLVRWAGIMLVALGLLFATLDAAHAKRVGGGKSFGSRDSYSQPYSKPVSPDRSGTTTQQSTPGQTGGPQTATPPLSRPGLFGGLGGMFGGLLMGGLIGSMLFGGAGGGFGILEMLLVGGGVFLLLRFLRSRGAARQDHARAAVGDRLAYAAPQPGAFGSGPGDGRDDGWTALRQSQAAAPAAAAGPVLPAGVDEAEFVSGVKALYARLQASWDRRDLDDIRRFASAEVFAEISRQAAEDPAPGKTDVLMVEARVLEAATHDGQTVVTVLFDALLREEASAASPNQVREVWRTRRAERAAQPEWTLEGNQQLEM